MWNRIRQWLPTKNEKGTVIMPVAVLIAAIVIIGGVVPLVSDLMVARNVTGAISYLEARGYIILAAGELDVDSLQFDIEAPAPAYSEGLVFYDGGENALSYYNNEPDVTLNIGQELWVYVRNDTVGTIEDGEAVYISGAIGNRPTVALAQADDIATSHVLGLATHSIEPNSNGYITFMGILHGLKTDDWTIGDALYLSATEAGKMTATPPSNPNYIVIIAVVILEHGENGELLVLPTEPVAA